MKFKKCLNYNAKHGKKSLNAGQEGYFYNDKGLVAGERFLLVRNSCALTEKHTAVLFVLLLFLNIDFLPTQW